MNRTALLAPERSESPSALDSGEPAGAGRWESVTKKLRLGVSVALLGWLAWRTDWGRIHEAFGHLRFGLWLAAVAVYFLAQLISGYRWQLLARPLGFHEPLRRFTAFYFVGMYFNLLLPTSVGGDVIRAWCLGGGSGRRVAAFVTVFVDRFSGLLVLVVVACVGVLACPVAIPAWVAGSVWGVAGGAAAGLALAPFLARRTARFSLVERLAECTRFYMDRPRLWAGTTGLSVGVQVANVVLVWLVGRALDLPVPAAYYFVLVPLVTLVTLLPVSLNGMGIREASTVVLLEPFGVNQGTALCLAVLWFFVLCAVSLSGGVVYLWGGFPKAEVRPRHDAIRRDSVEGRAGQPQAAA
jgi:uncharacterized membrane protein YbhN (UPF0104 family)